MTRPGDPAGAGGSAARGRRAGPPDDAGPPAGGGLRQAFGGLTTRGRSFLAAGAAACVCAYLLGQSDLLRVGLLMAVLPLVCVLVLFRVRHQVTGGRSLAPSRVEAMSQARVSLRLENVSRLPTGLLMLQDQVPYVLGPRPRFVLDRVEAGGTREVSYRVRSDLRGRYELGPLQLRLTDPFGMCELTRSFGDADTLTVVPRVDPLPPVGLAGRAAGRGESRDRSLALSGEDDVIPRGYRHGDDLRRVHWRSTARYGQLMVRREEQPQRSYCTVLLDTRRGAYPGAGPDSAFEWAVSGAASVAVHLMERGLAARLLTDDGAGAPGRDSGPDGWSGADRPEATGTLLEALAVVDHSGNTGFTRAREALRDHPGGLLVAFVGEVAAEDAEVLARMRHRTAGAVAFVLDGRDDGADGARAGIDVLRGAGWTVLLVRPGDELADLWRQADRAHRQAADQKGFV
ncbi:DUF58 domain-containing protein [Streptantibioticus silvisoli]|uniref:DUF58 domain-containing protein n=1 Tax=Streptantibioticus silvisoli TaxID=2705255 RepID=UPI003F6AC92B